MRNRGRNRGRGARTPRRRPRSWIRNEPAFSLSDIVLTDYSNELENGVENKKSLDESDIPEERYNVYFTNLVLLVFL